MLAQDYADVWMIVDIGTGHVRRIPPPVQNARHPVSYLDRAGSLHTIWFGDADSADVLIYSKLQDEQWLPPDIILRALAIEWNSSFVASFVDEAGRWHVLARILRRFGRHIVHSTFDDEITIQELGIGLSAGAFIAGAETADSLHVAFMAVDSTMSLQYGRNATGSAELSRHFVMDVEVGRQPQKLALSVTPDSIRLFGGFLVGSAAEPTLLYTKSGDGGVTWSPVTYVAGFAAWPTDIEPVVDECGNTLVAVNESRPDALRVLHVAPEGMVPVFATARAHAIRAESDGWNWVRSDTLFVARLRGSN